jgi:hypothetical protein
MPTPKLTGLLNNCALNSALPSLLMGISKLANTPEANYPGDDTVFKSYQLLKNCFANYYGINPEALNWLDFNNFLESHSFYAKEMILAPVFRSFIANRGPHHDYRHDDLWLLKDVQDDGRYNQLEAREAASLFHYYFGISLEAYVFVQGDKPHKVSSPYHRVNPSSRRPAAISLPISH